MVNVEVGGRGDVAESDGVVESIRLAELALGENGRVLVRASGTEPLVRVMVEAPTEEEARAHADDVAESIRTALR
jgi:phosphoglucosamine mutase